MKMCYPNELMVDVCHQISLFQTGFELSWRMSEDVFVLDKKSLQIKYLGEK